MDWKKSEILHRIWIQIRIDIMLFVWHSDVKKVILIICLVFYERYIETIYCNVTVWIGMNIQIVNTIQNCISKNLQKLCRQMDLMICYRLSKQFEYD